jgi:hypothetical protein
MKKLLSALVALSLTGCTTFTAVSGFDPSASTASVRNPAGKALIVAWRALSAFETAGTILLTVPAGHPIIAPGSPRALQMASVADRTRHALNAATDALRAGNSANFAAAMAQAEQALSEAHAAMENSHG